MNKFITLTTALNLFFLSWCCGATAPATEAPANTVSCNRDFLQGSALITRCRLDGTSFDVYMFKPAGGSGQHGAAVLYLLGGPGSLAKPQEKRFSATAAITGRVILVPAIADGLKHLDCHSEGASEAVWGIAPEPEDAVIYGRENHAKKLDRCISQIRETMAQGATSGLTTENIADQLKRLRESLQIEAWHLFAESYGARIALMLSSKDLTGTLTQTLDSPETPWVKGFWHTGENFFRALQTLGGYCRDHFYCPAKRRRLERDLLKDIATADVATGAPVALKNIRTGHIDAYARPTREQLLISSFHALRNPSRAAILPYIAASPGQTRERFGLLLDQLLYPSDGLNTGMHHLIRCRELPMEQWYRSLEADKLKQPHMAPFIGYLAWRQQYVCRALGITPPDDFRRPVLPQVPTMILSGELDPVTPADIVDEAFSNQPGYSTRLYRTLGHVTHAQKQCVLDDVMAFWASPEARLARTSCSSDDLALRFYSPVVVR